MKSGIIIADNDVIIRGILRSLLSAANQDVFLASNGEEAVTLAMTRKARLVLLDLEMPRMNGFLACKQIRLIPGYATTPIVILTSHDNDQARRAAAIVGVSLFVTKPFQIAALLQLISPFLQLDAAARHTIAREASTAAGVLPGGVPRILDVDGMSNGSCSRPSPFCVTALSPEPPPGSIP